MKIDIITTCMGRRNFLAQALPSWLEHTEANVMLVDYNCPQDSGHWASMLGNPRITVYYADAVELDHGRPLFDKPRATNIALACSRADYVLLMDADVVVETPLFWEFVSGRLTQGSMLIAPPIASERELGGFLGAPTDKLARAGLDETIRGWGAHDLDLRVRLYLEYGLVPKELAPGLLRAIPHTDVLRNQFYDVPMREAQQTSMQRLAQNAERITKRPFTELLLDPVVKRLLGEPESVGNVSRS